MRLEYHPGVARDLRTIIKYYDDQSLTARNRFLSEFQAVIEGIKANPARHHFVAPDRRRCNLKRFPYHLIYEVTEDVIHVLVVRHHRRHPDYGMRRRWK